MSGRVRREYGVLESQSIQLSEESDLGLEILGDRFDHNVGLGDRVSQGVSECEQCQGIWSGVWGCRRAMAPRGGSAVDRLACSFELVGADVEAGGRDSRGCERLGYPGAHRTGSDDSDTVDRHLLAPSSCTDCHA